jgi:site-specific recombinase XerD
MYMDNERQIFRGNDDEKLPAEIRHAALPALIVRAGEKGAYRFLEFFAAHIRNPNTRQELSDIRSAHIAGYVEQLMKTHTPPSVKQHLAAIRMLFNWLVVGQIVEHNPAAAVRGPRYVVNKGKTPVLLGQEARKLLDTIRMDTLVGLRDRALVALLVYTFARVSAAVHMHVEDVYIQGRRMWVRLHEKGGKEHTLPCHHELEQYLQAYIDAAGMAHEKGTPLFRSAVGKTGQLTKKPMHRIDAFRMVKRRAAEAAILSPIGCHTFRATGITQYLLHGGKLEHAQHMAAHELSRTTGLYDRRKDEVTLGEVERILLT